MIDAVYHQSIIPEFSGNPCIEALPPAATYKELIDRLPERPQRPKNARKVSEADRILLTQQVLRFFQPLGSGISLALSIDKCLRWGYVGRNRASTNYVWMVNERYEAGLRGALPEGNIFRKTYGFSVLGVSGVGKTTAMEAILKQYPQVIRHTSYNGLVLEANQVVWLKIDCPCDGSLKALCKSFFQTMDNLLGTDYSSKYHRYTLDDLIIEMASIAARENLGILVIDEVQHLKAAKNTVSAKVLNFLVSLVNKIGLPVILVGTPDARDILQQDFQQAKRASGQGDITLGNLTLGSPEWTTFIKAMWKYQYTKNNVKPDSDIEKALYDETFGNQFLITVLFMLVQEEAIMSGKETFDPKYIHDVAVRRLSLTGPMREALKKGNDVNLKGYLEEKGIWEPWYETKTMEDLGAPDLPINENAPVPRPVDRGLATERAIKTLVDGFGMKYSDAYNSVFQALQDLKDTPSEQIIAQKAYRVYLDSLEQSQSPANDPVETGYDAMKEKGLIGSEI